MNKLRLFSADISPSCSYCKHGNFAKNKLIVLCEKRGVMQPDDFCNKFYYAPLKRIPKRKPKLTSFDPSDFQL